MSWLDYSEEGEVWVASPPGRAGASRSGGRRAQVGRRDARRPPRHSPHSGVRCVRSGRESAV